MPPEIWKGDTTDQHISDFLHLLKVYINDFIQLAQSTDPTQLLHLSCALLHGIHSVFPPPSVTGGGAKEDPIALKKKLHQGNSLWESCKKLLGWVFDGIKCCSELPTGKHDHIQTKLQTLCQRKKAP